MMETAQLSESCSLPGKLAGNPEGSLGLNISIVYEDAGSREWAGVICGRVGGFVSHEIIRPTWWRLADLAEPAVLAGAVSTAMRADVIVVALRAAEGLPLPFYVWVDCWLPHHAREGAALVALITMPDNPSPRLDRARNFLRAVAEQGHLDFLIQERKQPLEPAHPADQRPGSCIIASDFDCRAARQRVRVQQQRRTPSKRRSMAAT